MGTENSEGGPPDAQDPQEAEKVRDLITIKYQRMPTDILIGEIMVHIRALERGVMHEDHKIRTRALLNEGSKRDSLRESWNDFQVALKVLKHL
jgi:hypothetical protein